MIDKKENNLEQGFGGFLTCHTYLFYQSLKTAINGLTTIWLHFCYFFCIENQDIMNTSTD